LLFRLLLYFFDIFLHISFFFPNKDTVSQRETAPLYVYSTTALSKEESNVHLLAY
jgi:hypothetical protein